METSEDLELILDALERADAEVRALYRQLAEDPDLASEHEVALRDLHAKRSELARRVGLRALALRREAPLVETVDEPPAPEPERVVASAEQVEQFKLAFAAPAAPRVAPQFDDRPLLLTLAANVQIGDSPSTPSAFDAEVDNVERACFQENQERWRRLSRDNQVRWLSMLVAWAKALEGEAATLGAPTHRISASFRDLRAFSIEHNPGFVHGFARTALPKGATWRADALRWLKELRPERAKNGVRPATAPTVDEAEEDDDDDDGTPDALAGWEHLDRVRDLRVVIFGGVIREERRAALERTFHFASLEWVPTDRPRQVAALAERVANGSVDIVLVTKFVAHKETKALSGLSETPILVMRRGYGVTTVKQSLEDHFRVR